MLSVAENHAFGVSLYITVLQNVKSPTIQLLIASKFITKLDHNIAALTPKIIYELLKYSKWDRSSVAPTPPKKAVPSSFASEYPCLLRNPGRKKVTKIFDSQYVEVLHLAYAAYKRIHHILEVKAHLESAENSSSVLNDYTNAMQTTTKNRNRIAKFCKVTEKMRQSVASHPIFYVENDHLFPKKITVSNEMASSYRDNFKYCEITDNVIIDLKKEFTELFNSWKD